MIPQALLDSGWTDALLQNILGSAAFSGIVYYCTSRSKPKYLVTAASQNDMDHFCDRLGSYLPEARNDMSAWKATAVPKVALQRSRRTDIFLAMRRACKPNLGRLDGLASCYPIQPKYAKDLEDGVYDLREVLDRGLNLSARSIPAFYLGFAWANGCFASSALVRATLCHLTRVAHPDAVVACRPTNEKALTMVKRLGFRIGRKVWGSTPTMMQRCYARLNEVNVRALKLGIVSQ